MKKSKVKLLIGSLAFSAVLSAAAILPASCTNNANQAPEENQNPGGNDNPSQGNGQQQSKFQATNELLNVAGNPKSFDLYNAYIDAISANDSQPENPIANDPFGALPPELFESNPIGVAMKFSEISVRQEFIDQLIGMFESNLVPAEENAAALSEALADMRQNAADMINQQANEQAAAFST